MKRNTGSSMVEVMIALFVMAVGLLGVLAMQVQSVQMNQNAHLFSQAAFLTTDIMESMRTTGRNVMPQYTSDSDSPVASVSCGGGCSAGDMVNWHLNRWQENVTTLLPDGRGVIDSCDGSTCRVEISFVVGYEEDGGTGVAEAQRRTVSMLVGI